MESKLKVAVVGLGGIGGTHLDAYKKLSNAEIYALCDINETKLQQRGKEYGVTRLYTDEAQMLAELPEIDAVDVCTWNSAHAPCTIMALEAQKHVLCEKPMAMNAQEALRMEEAAKQNNKLLMIGFIRRFGNDCSVLKEFIEDGMFGDFYFAKASYTRRFGFPGGWFGDKSRSGGGPLIDLGVHVIDLTRYLAGNPKAVSVFGVTSDRLKDRPGIKAKAAWASQTETEKPIFDVEDFAAAMIRFDNGLTMEVETSFNLNQAHDVGELHLYGTKAGATLDPQIKIFTQQLSYLTDVTPAMDTSFDFFGSMDAEIAHFVDCVINSKPCRNPAEDGVELMRILDAIYASAATGREVLIER